MVNPKQRAIQNSRELENSQMREPTITLNHIAALMVPLIVPRCAHPSIVTKASTAKTRNEATQIPSFQYHHCHALNGVCKDALATLAERKTPRYNDRSDNSYTYRPQEANNC